MQIAEVAKRYGITVDTIRYYERIGLVPHVTLLPNGIRDFAEYDCGWVEFILCMRESGVQIDQLEDGADWRNAAVSQVWPEMETFVGGRAAINAFLSAIGKKPWK